MCAEDEVVSAGVRDANGGVNVGQGGLEDPVENDGCHVVEPKQRMVRVDGGQTQGRPVHHALVGQDTGGLVSVHHIDALSPKDPSQQRKGCRKGRHGHLIHHGHNRTIIHLEGTAHVTDPPTIVIGVRDNHHCVTQTNQILRQGPNVHLYTTQTRIKEITHQRNPMLARGDDPILHACVVFCRWIDPVCVFVWLGVSLQ